MIALRNLTHPARDRIRPDSTEQLCPDVSAAIATGDVDAVHAHLADIRPDWGWAKRLRYARKLINHDGEERARAVAYALAPAAPRDQFKGRHSEGVAPRDLTGNRAAFNIDTLAGGGAHVA